jgi:hypothetical protein
MLAPAGCNDLHPPPPPASEYEALQRVNDNLSRIDRPLYCPGFVRLKLRDDDGRAHDTLVRDARLLYEAPNSLRLDVKSNVGVIAQFGSNDQQYWAYNDVDPKRRKLWFGNWANLSPGSAPNLAVPPDLVFDALMLRPLPLQPSGGLTPVLRVEGEDQRLLYFRVEDGRAVSWREIRLSPRAPFQPVEVIDRRSDGAIVMHATLEKWRPVGAGGPLVAREYVILWPLAEAELRVSLTDASFQPPLPSDAFASPVDAWRGEVECVDPPPADGELDDLSGLETP